MINTVNKLPYYYIIRSRLSAVTDFGSIYIYDMFLGELSRHVNHLV